MDSNALFAEGAAVMLEFSGGPFDGQKILKQDWPKGCAWPATEVLDKPTGSLYRYNLPDSVNHAVYTYRPKESASAIAMASPPTPQIYE